jgi:hypothetical protein
MPVAIREFGDSKSESGGNSGSVHRMSLRLRLKLIQEVLLCI